MPVIYEPDAYIDVFNKHGTVTKSGEYCEVSDWEDCARKDIKIQVSGIFSFIHTNVSYLHYHR